MVPRKPHPFGNEYHSINDRQSTILFGLELMEGEDEPPEKLVDPNDAHGKTVGLLLRLREPLFSTGKVVVLDSGFCVLCGLVELMKRGVYAALVIKKRRYWPRFVDGDMIDQGMDDKEVGDVGILSGVLTDVPFNIFCMKEPTWNMKLVSTYGDKETPPNQEQTRRFFKTPPAKPSAGTFITPHYSLIISIFATQQMTTKICAIAYRPLRKLG